ncbi:MAG: DUF3857 domain-containing protein [Acidobacteriales bacterium]|nr:DUF3857 domain-containing protein [Terriglobales bacterium]
MNCGKMACVLVVLWSALTVAQAPVPSPALPQTTSTSTDSPKDYSKESIVVESSVGRFWFENDGTGTRQLSVRMRIQSEAGVRQAGVLRLAYASALEALHIEYVRVHKPDGTVIETPADGAQDIASDVTQQAPTYSDVREKHIPVKSLAAGDLLEYSARWNLFKPVTPGHFSFASDFDRSLIYLEQKLEINVPRDRAVKLKSAGLKPVITEQGARRVYTWTTSQLEHPSDKDQKKQQAQQQRQVRTGTLPPPAVRLSSFQSWEEVGRWYDGLQKERIEPTPEIQKRAAQLTRDATTENDKIRALYDYVSLRVRYVGVDLGVSAFQPHSAESVEGNGYGDCKDKHTLLATLLAAEGIHAYAALINTQRDLDTDVPSPSQFNHVVTAVETDKGIIWLDTTPEVAPFGWLLPPLRGKNALVVSAPAVLKKIPDAPPFRRPKPSV